MNKYECEFCEIFQGYGGNDSYRARVKMLEDHKGMGGRAGEHCITSQIQSVDFTRHIIITENSIYHYK